MKCCHDEAMTRSGKREVAIGARGIVPLHFFRWAVILAAALLFATGTFGQTAGDAGTAQRRAKRLQHGINLSHWFSQVFDPKGYTKEHFDVYDTA